MESMVRNASVLSAECTSALSTPFQLGIHMSTSDLVASEEFETRYASFSRLIRTWTSRANNRADRLTHKILYFEQLKNVSTAKETSVTDRCEDNR